VGYGPSTYADPAVFPDVSQGYHEAGEPVMEKAKILLVDDRQDNLLALEAVLSSLDQIVVRANSGEEALDALLADSFAVVLLDVYMPGMDGFETARHIKRRQKTKDIPIIFLTAINNEPAYTFRGYAAGVVDYVTKPFDPWVLRSKVQVFIDLYWKNQQLTEQADLLRGQLLGREESQGFAHGAGSSVLAQLQDRLAAVTEQAKLAEAPLRRTEDPAAAEIVPELYRRLDRLRAGLDALTPGAP